MKKETNELNEQVICKCKAHWMALVKPAIIAAFFLLLFFAGISGTKNKEYAFLFLAIAILSFGLPFLRVKTSHLTLSNMRIYGKTGILKIKELSAPISKIQTVNIDKKIFGRVFGYADITIHCITGIYTFEKQSNAEEMQNAILNTIK